ncbi:polymerase [Limosilactobacillus sp. STM2_1]|uniref:Polymerase n=1 Tax=Limosilactobacillus rudii TaxID=2759755 RepID=A0A7W3ULI3_9LACO|nr:polymerase [Limosilactobacillus rudii]MBB1079792.1 polymerase [Limosilactobacillus rudii]MBB1097748.1 polymerase [Limosilactobacillus rudii]MCD7134829.1 polymerase [Limosilactobacillus rudii]
MLKIKEILRAPINGQQLYLGVLVFYLFFSFLRNTTFDPYLGSRPFNLASYICVAILIFKIYFLDSHELKEKILITFFLLIAICSWRLSTSNLIIVMATFIVAAKGVPFTRIIQYYFYTTLILLISVVAFSLLGVIKDLVFVVHGRATRYALGIVYPTDLASHVLYLLLAHVYLYYNKLNWRYYTGYVLVALLLKFITDARLSIICILLILPVVWIAKLAESPQDRVAHFIISLYWIFIPLLAFVSFAGTYFFDNTNHIYYKIDHLLSGRLSYGLMSMYRYHFTMLGQKVEENGLGGSKGLSVFHHGNVGYFYIDSSYLRLIMIYGLLVTIIILGLMITISVRSVMRRNYAITAILLIVTLSCFVEQHLLELSYNPFLLALLANPRIISEVNTNWKRKSIV